MITKYRVIKETLMGISKYYIEYKPVGYRDFMRYENSRFKNEFNREITAVEVILKIKEGFYSINKEILSREY